MRIRSMMMAGAALLLGAAVLAPSAAFAGDGWYIGLGSGWDELKSPRIQGAGFNGQLGTKQAPPVAGTLGYRFDALPIRVELEGSWVSHDVSNYTQAGIGFPGTGKVEERALMLNGLYDVRVLPRLRLSFGGGVGLADDRIAYNQTGGPGLIRSGLRKGFMWQAIAGAAFDVTRDLDLFIDYHYRDLRNGSNRPGVPFASANLRENVVMAGLRWYPFEQEEVHERPRAAPLPTPPPPPPPPALPAPVQTFVLFFDFNKSNLTVEAQSVVAQAVNVARQSNFVRVRIVGHTDTVGSDRYNQTLSERRARSVKDEMMREGMKADDIATTGDSFHDPLIATGPGVREPQNRRAVIDLGN